MNVIGFKLQPARYVSWFFLLSRAKGLGTPCFGFHLDVCVTVAENEREQCRNIMVTFGSEGPAISSTIETSSSSETVNCAPKDFFCSFLLRKSQLRDQTVAIQTLTCSSSLVLLPSSFPPWALRFSLSSCPSWATAMLPPCQRQSLPLSLWLSSCYLSSWAWWRQAQPP